MIVLWPLCVSYKYHSKKRQISLQQEKFVLNEEPVEEFQPSFQVEPTTRVKPVPQIEPKSSELKTDDVAYLDSWEHLSDELARLNIQIYRQRHLQRNRSAPNAWEQLQGVVLSEEEINELLSELSGITEGHVVPEANHLQDDRLLEALKSLELKIAARRAASLQNGIYLSLPHLAQIFSLTPFEEKCILICLAPELDRKYEKIYAYLQDDITRKKASVDLVLKLLCPDAREKLKARLSFDPHAALLKFRLVQFSDNSGEGPLPLLSRFLKLDDRIANFLLTINRLDARLETVAQLSLPDLELLNESNLNEIRSRVSNFVQWSLSGKTSVRPNLVFYLRGGYGSGRHNLAQLVCGDLGLPLIIGDMTKLLEKAAFEDLIFLLAREAVLQPAALCLENCESILSDTEKYQSQLKAFTEAIQTFSRLTFLIGTRPWNPETLSLGDTFIDVDFPFPDAQERKQLWEQYFREPAGRPIDTDFGDLASKFRFTPGQIHNAATQAKGHARWREPETGQITSKDLFAACRRQSNQKLSALARKVNPKFQWGDIILPSDQLDQLKEVCNQAKYKNIVYSEWGFARKLSLGNGLNVMFSGPSGTGKTMAAEIISNELSLDLYKIDLSQVVSKYIGETEKNLDKIFTEAQSSNAILFFDEADALFGKRSEVKDAHDRYANIEIGYLLQKMEEYDGIAILATNLRQSMDEAFVRRIHIIVEFLFPDEGFRRRIWEIVFPPETPLGEDVEFDLLAREVKMPGGNIKNIAVAAAFYAADNGRVVRMKHLIRAVRREYQKSGRVWSEMDWSKKITRN